MDFILHGYEVNNPTWFYLSFLLIIAVYFRFNRIWSLRNLDLALLLSIAPALLYTSANPQLGSWGLLAVTGGLLVRVLFDASFTRRPKLPQNMNPAGLTFLACAAAAFLMTKVMTEPPPFAEVAEAHRAQRLVQGEKPAPLPQTAVEAGPGSRLLYAAVAATPAAPRDGTIGLGAAQYLARSMAILAHLAVIAGLLCIAHYHLADLQLGLAMAALYLLLPCTAYEVGRVNHVLPAACVMWAFVAYRRVLVCGSLMGLACGTLFFPVFLLPGWVAFYGRRGAWRFCAAVAGVTLLLVASASLIPGAAQPWSQGAFGFFDWTQLQFQADTATGLWNRFDAAYRIPVFVCFLILVAGLTLWPRPRTLATLMADSAAVIIATQFWYPQHGTVYVLWYLPILLLVVFRSPLQFSVPPEPDPDVRPHSKHAEAMNNPTSGSGVGAGALLR